MLMLKELREKRAAVIKKANDLVALAKGENRDLTVEEQEVIDGALVEYEQLGTQIQRAEKLEAANAHVNASAGRQAGPERRSAPPMLTIPRGDSEERAFAHWYRTGDDGGIRELRASNDTTMNITTAADGGYAVPTGHYQGIIAKRDEGMLANKLGLMPIPGKGTTVNVPVDDEDNGEFVSTAESNAYDRDAPALTYKPMTLVKYTKKMDFTVGRARPGQDSQLIAVD